MNGMRQRRGFTFVELLAAMAFVTIVIPVGLHGLVVSARAGEVARAKREAGRLAHSWLSEQALTGDWREGESEGDFGEEKPGYRWEISDDAWDVDTMRVLTVEVFFTIRGDEFSVRMRTLVEETEETEEPEESGATDESAGATNA